MSPAKRKRKSTVRKYRYKHLEPNSLLGPAFGNATLRQYAIRSKIPMESLRYAIDGGYLKVVSQQVGAEVIVEVPSPALTAWLRAMLKPMAVRPLLKLGEIADILGIERSALRALCNQDKRIKFTFDPAFGELVTPRTLFFVLKRLPKSHGIPSFDRARLIQFLTGDHLGRGMKFQVLPYNEQIEREIKRIANIKEPYRTLRAVALYEAMKDAKNFVECLKEYRERAKREEVEFAQQSITRLVKSL